MGRSCVVLLFIFIGGCTPKGESIIKVGMEYEKAEKLLKKIGAKETNIQVMPERSSHGGYMELEIYSISGKPYIVINHEKDNGKNIIKKLSLYHRKTGSKNRPDNKWENIDKIDLKDIGS